MYHRRLANMVANFHHSCHFAPPFHALILPTSGKGLIHKTYLKGAYDPNKVGKKKKGKSSSAKGGKSKGGKATKVSYCL